MIEVFEAKQRAESFLSRVLEQKWDESITLSSSAELRDDAVEWPTRLEAYAYLGPKDKGLTQPFEKELTGLWNKWLALHQSVARTAGRPFWELNEFFFERKPDRWLAARPELDIDNTVAMFRVREVLGIRGFEEHFEGAIRYLTRWILGDDVFADTSNTFVWQIARSRFLRNSLKSHLAIFFVPQLRREMARIKREEDEERGQIRKTNGPRGLSEILGTYDLEFWSRVGFFLSLTGSIKTPESLTNKIALELAARQSESGSFEDDLLTTCLASLTIFYSDPKASKQILDRSLGWIMDQQAADGSWSSSDLVEKRERTETNPLDLVLDCYNKTMSDKTLTTVIVLETIDLILNLPPLPYWSVPDNFVGGEQHKRDLSQRLLPVPPGTKWHQVTIDCVSEEYIYVTVGEKKIGALNYTVLGFRDEKTKKPNILWRLLFNFGRFNGTISFENIALKVSVKDVSRLRKRLRELFGIEEDPLKYHEDEKSYAAEFKISDKEASAEILPSKSEVEQLLEEEQAALLIRNRDEFEREWEREITGESEEDRKKTKKEPFNF